MPAVQVIKRSIILPTSSFYYTATLVFSFIPFIRAFFLLDPRIFIFILVFYSTLCSSLPSSLTLSSTHYLIHSPTHYLIRINGVPTAVLVTAEQKADPTFLLLKWVLLFAPQLRRWRLGLVITRLDEGYIGSCVCVCVCVRVYLFVCISLFYCFFNYVMIHSISRLHSLLPHLIPYSALLSILCHSN
jgi:hypothetical protein